jgi:hypothetical protein
MNCQSINVINLKAIHRRAAEDAEIFVSFSQSGDGDWLKTSGLSAVNSNRIRSVAADCLFIAGISRQ